VLSPIATFLQRHILVGEFSRVYFCSGKQKQMKAIKFIILLALAQVVTGVAFAKTGTNVKGAKEIEKINQRALRWFRKSDCYVPGSYETVNLLYVGFRGEFRDRKEVANRLEELIEPVYPKYDKRHWENMTYICNKEGLIVASTEYRKLYCMAHYNSDAFEAEQQLIDKLREKKISKAYSFFSLPLNCLGIDKNNDVYLFREIDGAFECTKVEELSDQEWLEALNPLP